MAWTTTDLLAEVRRIGQFPTSSSSSLANADILAQADRAMQASLVPLVLKCQEEFFVRRLSQTLTAGTGAYPIPRRSIGSRVRDVQYITGTVRSNLPRIRPEQIPDWTTMPTGFPTGFYLDAANIILLPAPSAADSLSIAVYVRPGRLTLDTTASRRITTVTANTPTAGRTKLTFGTYSSFGATVDIISGTPPFEHKGLDLDVANITTTSLDVSTAALLATPVSGDWLTDPDTSPVMQLPVEAHPLLASRTAQYVMRGLGYIEEARELQREADAMAEDVVQVLTPRTDGSPLRVTGGLMRLIDRSRGW